MITTTNFEAARDAQTKKSWFIVAEPWELLELRKSLKAYKGRLVQQLKRVENNPLNEGQCHYNEQARELRFLIDFCDEQMKNFFKP